MDEHELRESLRRLPDARPGAEFTAEVLARVERRERQRMVAAGGHTGDRARAAVARWRPTLLAAGLAAALIAAAGLWQPLAGGRWSGVGGDQIAAPDAPGTERLGEEGRSGRAGGGEGAAAGAARTGGLAEEAAGEGPAGTGASVPPLADVVSAATETGGSVGEGRLASAAGSVDDLPTSGSAADGRAVIPSTADAGLPGADFFAAPPPAGDAVAALPAAQRLARLRAERESLERRLVAFRRELPPAEPPVVLLAGDDGLDLVFDLGRWAAAPPAGEAAGAVRPAVHSNPGPPRRF